MDANAFQLRLSSLPFLSKTNVASYQKRAQQGGDLTKLYREALRLHKQRRVQEIGKRKVQFQKMIANLGLSYLNRRRLMTGINNKTNLRVLLNRAKKLKEIRKKEAKSRPQKAFVKFLDTLKIDQADKQQLVKKFDEGESVEVLRQDALAIQKRKATVDVAKDRQFLEDALKRLGISQTNQDSILRKFKPGKKSVRRLIEEGRRLKELSGKQDVKSKKDSLLKFAQSLGVEKNFSDRISKVKTDEEIEVLKQTIQDAGETRRTMSVTEQKEKLVTIARELGLYTTFAGPIAGATTKDDLDIIRVNLIESGKKSLSSLASDKGVETKIPTVINLNRLVTLKKNITRTATEKAAEKKRKNMEKLSRDKQLFINFVQKSELPKNKQQVFINRMKLNNVNIPKLRTDVKTMVENMKKTSRQKNLDELRAYVRNLNINGNKFIQNFQSTNISLTDAKKKINEAMNKKAQLKANKNALLQRAGKISFNLNVSNIKTVNDIKLATEKLNKEYQKKIAENKKRLSNIALRADSNVLNDLSGIRNIDKIKNAENIIKQRVKEKLYALAYDAGMNDTFMTRINKINSGQDVKNIKQAIKNFIYSQNKQLKNMMTAQQKQLMAQERKVQKLTTYLTNIGLRPDEHGYFVEKMLMYNEPIKTLQNEANAYLIQNVKKQREFEREKLYENLTKLELNQSNIEYIMKKFTNTYIPANRLVAEAKYIEGKRKHERWVQMDEELINYLDTLNLPPENRRKITTALNSYYVNFAPLKKSATNLAIKAMNSTRSNQRKQLSNYMNTRGLSKRMKLKFLQMFDLEEANFNTLKQNVNRMKNDETTRNQTKKQRKVHLQSYIVNNLGLNLSNQRIQRILDNYNKYPENINRHMSEVEGIRMLSNEKMRLKERAKGLPEPQKFNQRVANAKNMNDIMKINQDINKAYVGTLRKEISNMALQSGLKFKLNLANINTVGEAEEIRAKILQSLNQKKTTEYVQLQQAIRNMSEQDQNLLLQKFASQNISLKNVLKNVSELRKKRADEKHTAERKTLYDFINNELNLNVKDRQTILKNFNNTKNLAAVQEKARQLKQTRVTEKIANNRLKVEKLIEPLNLSDADKKTILNSFNTNPGDVLKFETQAKELKKLRKNEKRSNERQQLLTHLKSLQLSETNTKKIMNIFDVNPEQKLDASKSNASNLRVQRNREKLVGLMKNMVISTNNKKTLLKSFAAKPSNINALISRAKQLNTASRTQLNLQKRLRNYVVSLRLGENGTKILKKIDKTLTPESAKSIRAEADRAKAESDAILIRKKRDEIKKFMNASNLGEDVKSSFLGGIKLNTNVDTLKRKIQTTIQNIKKQTSRRGKLRTELKVYLNTLNLTNDQKKSFIGRVGDKTKSISSLKTEAKRIVDRAQALRLQRRMRAFGSKSNAIRAQAKTTRAQIGAVKASKNIKNAQNRQKRMDDKRRLEKHLYSLPDLSKREINMYTKQYINGDIKLSNLVSISESKNRQIKRDKIFLKDYISKLPIRNDTKKQYLNKLNNPRADIFGIKTNIKNHVVKEITIPTKDKKTIINTLLKVR